MKIHSDVRRYNTKRRCVTFFIKLCFLFLLCCDRLSVYIGARVIFLKYSLDLYSLTLYDVPGTEVHVREIANTGGKKSLPS